MAKKAKVKNQVQFPLSKQTHESPHLNEFHDDDYGRYYADEAAKNRQMLEKLFKIERNKMLMR